ncbi:hypothetical protein J6590_063581 [Homalodisca vitripennis]|nr:hypothetical protein J6590_063581 [Homalodisca vitripennis]
MPVQWVRRTDPHGIKQITMFIRENVECLDSSFTTTTTIKWPYRKQLIIGKRVPPSAATIQVCPHETSDCQTKQGNSDTSESRLLLLQYKPVFTRPATDRKKRQLRHERVPPSAATIQASPHETSDGQTKEGNSNTVAIIVELATQPVVVYLSSERVPPSAATIQACPHETSDGQTKEGNSNTVAIIVELATQPVVYLSSERVPPSAATIRLSSRDQRRQTKQGNSDTVAIIVELATQPVPRRAETKDSWRGGSEACKRKRFAPSGGDYQRHDAAARASSSLET